MGRPLRPLVSHAFDMSAERVFDAWLDPEMIGRFMFGPALREETVIHLKLDPRVGGAFSFKVAPRRSGHRPHRNLPRDRPAAPSRLHIARDQQKWEPVLRPIAR